jgi:hypothetical protein
MEASLPTTMDGIVALDDPIFDGKQSNDIFEISHVTDRRDYNYADDTAARERCEDFELYRPIFERLTAGLRDGTLITMREIENRERRKGVKGTGNGRRNLNP